MSVTLNEDGSQQIHISTRRPINTKGSKYSLPAPKGGKENETSVYCSLTVVCPRQARVEPQADRGPAGAAAEALQEGDEEKQSDGGGLPRRQLSLYHQGDKL